MPQACYWLSNGIEDPRFAWRDVQPFQRNLLAGKGYHLGADYNFGSDNARVSDKGRPVFPIAAGRVAQVLEGECGWGNIVFVRHDMEFGAFVSMYAHVSWLASGKPALNSQVSSSAPIARIGNGSWGRPKCRSTGSYPYHLHVEVRNASSPRALVPGNGYTLARLPAEAEGPQGQVDPNRLIVLHR